MTNTKQSIEIIEGLSVELTPEQLTEAARKLQSAADKARNEVPPLTSRRATVGDIVVITSNEGSSVNKVGDIGKIVLADHSSMPYRVEVPGRKGDANWEYEHCVRLATAKEIAKYEEATEPKLKVGDWVRAKVSSMDITEGKAYKVSHVAPQVWATIIDNEGDENKIDLSNFEIIDKLTPFDRAGRKPNEYKKGDIVRVIDALGSDNKSGDLVEVYCADGSSTPKVIDRHGDAVWSIVDLVTPVESRVDRAEGADVA